MSSNSDEHIWNLKKEIEDMRNKLDLINACAPGKAVLIKKKLMEKLLAKREKEANEALRLSNLPAMLW